MAWFPYLVTRPGAGPFVSTHFGFLAASLRKIKMRETFESSSRPCHHKSAPVNRFSTQETLRASACKSSIRMRDLLPFVFRP